MEPPKERETGDRNAIEIKLHRTKELVESFIFHFFFYSSFFHQRKLFQMRAKAARKQVKKKIMRQDKITHRGEGSNESEYKIYFVYVSTSNDENGNEIKKNMVCMLMH